MSKKFLKALTADDAKTFVMQNASLKSWINESKWDANKYNGIKLIKISEGSDVICPKAMELFNLNAAQMDYFKAYCKMNFPEAILGAGVPTPPAFSGAVAAPKKEAPKQAFTSFKISAEE